MRKNTMTKKNYSTPERADIKFSTLEKIKSQKFFLAVKTFHGNNSETNVDKIEMKKPADFFAYILCFFCPFASEFFFFIFSVLQTNHNEVHLKENRE